MGWWQDLKDNFERQGKDIVKDWRAGDYGEAIGHALVPVPATAFGYGLDPDDANGDDGKKEPGKQLVTKQAEDACKAASVPWLQDMGFTEKDAGLTAGQMCSASIASQAGYTDQTFLSALGIDTDLVANGVRTAHTTNGWRAITQKKKDDAAKGKEGNFNACMHNQVQQKWYNGNTDFSGFDPTQANIGANEVFSPTWWNTQVDVCTANPGYNDSTIKTLNPVTDLGPVAAPLGITLLPNANAPPGSPSLLPNPQKTAPIFFGLTDPKTGLDKDGFRYYQLNGEWYKEHIDPENQKVHENDINALSEHAQEFEEFLSEWGWTPEAFWAFSATIPVAIGVGYYYKRTYSVPLAWTILGFGSRTAWYWVRYEYYNTLDTLENDHPGLLYAAAPAAITVGVVALERVAGVPEFVQGYTLLGGIAVTGLVYIWKGTGIGKALDGVFGPVFSLLGLLGGSSPNPKDS